MKRFRLAAVGVAVSALASVIPAEAAQPTVVAGAGLTSVTQFNVGTAKTLNLVATAGNGGLLVFGQFVAQVNCVVSTTRQDVKLVVITSAVRNGSRGVLILSEGGGGRAPWAEGLIYPPNLLAGGGACGTFISLNALPLNGAAGSRVPGTQYVVVGG